jgi:hypothetical protein
MPRRAVPAFRERTVDELSVDDERSFRHVAVYADLKEILLQDRYVFRVLPRASAGRWDQALLLNLTFWGATGGDVLESDEVPADVVAHAAWHHLAAGALGIKSGVRPSAEALFLGESIASAFDVYLVGRLLGRAPKSSFLESQVSAMAQSSRSAGFGERDFEALLQGIARAPERAFGDLRRLLFDATLALWGCREAHEALAVLVGLDGHRFAPLLHHYELSNWVLYARAYAGRAGRAGSRARAVEATLRAEPDALAWLTSEWVVPALASRRRLKEPRSRA